MTRSETVASLTAEQEVLLGAIRADHAQDERLRELMGRGLDWVALRQIAINHEVFPLLYAQLRAVGEHLLPPEEKAQLRQLYLANAQRNLRLTQRLLRVLHLLASQGIEALPFKGPALAMQAYGDLSSRQIVDLDILIHRQDLARACELLPQLGYWPRPPIGRGEEKRLLMSATELEFTDGDSLVDVHWALHQWLWPIKMDPFWRQLRALRLNGVDVQVLSPENTLLSLCIVGARDQWSQLKLIADLAHLICAHPDLDWNALLGRAQMLGARKTLCLGLHMASEFGGVQFPPEVAEHLLLDPAAERLAVALKGRLFTAPEDWGKDSACLLPLSERFRDYLYYALTPKPRDRQVMHLPSWLYPLYYLVRPLRLLITYSAAFLRRSAAKRR